MGKFLNKDDLVLEFFINSPNTKEVESKKYVFRRATEADQHSAPGNIYRDATPQRLHEFREFR